MNQQVNPNASILSSALRARAASLYRERRNQSSVELRKLRSIAEARKAA